MDETGIPAHALDADRLLRLHTLTKEVAGLCLGRVRTHMEAMAPLFRPQRYLGNHIESTVRDTVAAADRNFADLEGLYAQVALKPFDLRPELRSPLESVATQFQFDEWEYTQAVETPRGWQSIRVTAPLTWVISYATTYSLTTLRGIVAGGGRRDVDAVRAFVVRACLMHELISKIPSLRDLLEGLRYKVDVRRSPQLGDLPLVTISAPFRTVRPSDKLVAMASGLAGGASFAEVLDTASVHNVTDPLRDQALEIVKRHPVEA